MGEDHEVVAVTGASAGVGRAVAREFGKRRARVGLIARGKDGLEAARKELEAHGGQAIVLPTDVAQADQVELAAAELEKTFGSIDVWVNDAMTSVFSPVWHLESEEVRRVTEVTYLGTVYGTMAGAWLMISAFVLPTISAATRWNNLIVGVVVVILSLLGTSSTAIPMRRTRTA
jgi:NAD(P)-dependent dehydrogenase (short-subunit alcohol dehydrogenase family)